MVYKEVFLIFASKTVKKKPLVLYPEKHMDMKRQQSGFPKKIIQIDIETCKMCYKWNIECLNGNVEWKWFNYKYFLRKWYK